MSEGLGFTIGGDTRPLQNALKAALGVATQTAASIGARYAAAAAGIDKAMTQTARNVGVTFGREIASAVSPAALGIGAGIAGFLALKFAVDSVGDAAKAAQERLADLVKIGANARDAGVGTTFLQSLTGQAKALGVEVGTLTAMLDKAREASTVTIGEGDGKASSPIRDRLQQNLKAGNLATVDLDRFTNADSQEARIKVILDLMDQLRAKGANLAAFDLARTMFGGEFENKLRTGVDMIGAMRRALDGISAGDQGRIIPPEEIQRAENLNRRLEEAQRTLETGLAPIQRDIAFWQQQQLAGWVDIKEQIAGAAAVAGRLYEWVAGIGKVLSSLGSSNVFATLRDYMDKAGLIDKAEVTRLERTLNGGLEATDKPKVPTDAGAGGPLQIAVKPKADTSRSLPSLSAPKAKAAPSATEISAIETFVGSLEKSAAALKAEADAYGKSSAERRIAIELAKAQEIATQNGTKLTEEQTRRIRESATAIAEQRDKLEDLRDSQENLRSAGREVFGGLYQDAKNGVGALDMLNNALGRIIDRIANSQIDGFVDALFGKSGSSGSLSGLFSGGISSFFGGKSGGSGGSLAASDSIALAGVPMFAAGVTALGIIEGPGTGTSDSILARVSKGESIVNAEATADHLPIVQAINSGATREELERLIHPDPKAGAEAPERAEAVTREAQRIVYRDRLEAAGVAADAIPPAPENPTPELRAAVRAIFVTRLRTELTSAMAEESNLSGSGQSDESVPTLPDIRQALDLRMPELPPAVLDRKGFLTGPGSGTSDSILARVSDGESIVKASATRKHRPLIEAMNADRLPAFATGMIGEAIGAMSMPAGASVRQDTGNAHAAANAAGPTKSELHIHGGAPETKAETQAGPLGPRTDIWLDRSVAATLQTGSQTRSTLKQIGGGKMVGG